MDFDSSSPQHAWRSTNLQTVWETVVESSSQFGLTRVADITKLDYLDIPVFIGIRPSAKTLCVSAGKGLTPEESFISAAMESIEIDIAENLCDDQFFYQTYQSIDPKLKIPFDSLPIYATSHFSQYSLVTWSQVHGYLSGTPRFYPSNFISMDRSKIQEKTDFFPFSSNGLASGLSYHDAVLSGLYEVIERDAWTCWEYLSRVVGIPLTSIEPSTIPFSTSLDLITKIQRQGLDIVLNPLHHETNIPIFRCLLLNDQDHNSGGISLGFGCHHSTEIAINRAITESVQARNVYISGSRDDIVMASIAKSTDISSFDIKNNYFPDKLRLSDYQFTSSSQAIQSILSIFDLKGWREPYIYRYPNSGPFSVVRVISTSLAPSAARHGMPFINHPRLTSFDPLLGDIQATFADLLNFNSYAP